MNLKHLVYMKSLIGHRARTVFRGISREILVAAGEFAHYIREPERGAANAIRSQRTRG